MKKLMATLLLLTSLATTSFADGLAPLEMAETLVTKAKLHKLIEDKDYTEDEIKDFVIFNNLMTTEIFSSDTVSFDMARDIFNKYDLYKLKETPKTDLTEDQKKSVFDLEYEELLKKDRKVSHEFMEKQSGKTYSFNDYADTLGSIRVKDQSFDFKDGVTGYDHYPLIDKYRYEAYRILAWYALEYDLYVEQTSMSVRLYTQSLGKSTATPLIEVGFLDTKDYLYNVSVRVSPLYYVPWSNDYTFESYRAAVEATNYEQARYVLALKDVSRLLFKGEEELNKFIESIRAESLENTNKEYDHVKVLDKIFDGKEWRILKATGDVEYRSTYDLSKWED